MKRPSRSLLCCTALLLSTAAAPAARFVSETTFAVPADQTVLGDVYFGGTYLRLDGRLEGSIVAGCQSATVSGRVERNLFVAAQSVDIKGEVAGDAVVVGATVNLGGRVGGAVRIGASTINIDGSVASDVLAGCGNLSLGRKAEVRGDLVAGCRSLEIAGVVRGDVKAAASDVVISGSIDGDVEVTVGNKLTLAPDARVYGDLRYRSDKKLDIANPDLVFGTIQHVQLPRPDEVEDLRKFRPRPGVFLGFLLPFAVLSVVGALVFGFVVIAIWKHALSEAIERAIRHWGRTFGFGAIGFLVGPMTILISFALILTIPVGLAALAAYLVALYLGKILAGMFVGRLLFQLFGAREVSIWLAAPVGIVVVWALCAIPVAGWILWLFALAIGFGIIAELFGMSRQP